MEHAGSNGHGGKLVVTMDWVFATDGSKIALSNASQSGSSGDKKGAASTAAIAGYVLLGPLGLFAHNFVHGKDVTIGTDKTFNMFTDHNVEVNQIHSAAPESTVTPAATPAANQLRGAAY